MPQYDGRTRSAHTRRAYASAWRIFTSWCVSRDLKSLPADPTTVARYIFDRTFDEVGGFHGVAPATLRSDLASIRYIHLGAGFSSPTVNKEVYAALEVADRFQRNRHSLRKLPVSENDVMRMADASDDGSLRGMRDRAIILMGFAGALRRSEISALDVEDMRFHDSGLIVIIRSKAGRVEDPPEHVALPDRYGSRYCPIEALYQWIKMAGIDSGAVFRRIRTGDNVGFERLHPQSMARIVKRLAGTIGLDPNTVSTHSLRSGFVSQVAKDCIDPLSVIAHARCRSMRDALAYLTDDILMDKNPTRHLLNE